MKRIADIARRHSKALVRLIAIIVPTMLIALAAPLWLRGDALWATLLASLVIGVLGLAAGAYLLLQGMSIRRASRRRNPLERNDKPDYDQPWRDAE